MAQIGEISLLAKIETSNYKKGAAEINRANKDIEGSAKQTEVQTESMSRQATKSLSRLAVAGFKVATAAAVGFGSAVAAMTIKGGISRALNIEDAQAKLKGLGHDTKSVETIMESALNSVLGTAYGLDQAATAAASAVAAGVKPGQELTKYLSTAADAATIAGVSFDEMGSIFGKVQTQQRAYTQELNQLADRGIPIYQWLQEELGLSQEALREMVAAGELDSKTYFKVIQDNIGGAALESGKTTRGAWANMQAAMSRVGAAIVEDIIPKVRDSFGDITEWFDKNSDNIVNAVGSIMDTLKNFGASTIEVGRQVAEYLGPKLQELWTVISEQLIPAAMQLWREVIQPLIPILGTAFVFAVGAVIDIMKIAIGVIAEVTDFLGKNKDATQLVIVALVSFKLTMAIGKAAAAFNASLAGMRGALALYRTQGLATAMAETKVFKTLITTPMVMPAIVITAALTAIWKVAEEGKKLQGILDGAAESRRNLDNARTDYGLSLKRKFERGEITAEERADLWKRSDPGLAKGTDYWKGGMTWVGERGPELINLPRGSQVIPNHQIDDELAQGGYEYNIGTINISSEVDGERWLQRLTKNQEIVSSRMTPRRAL